MGWLETAKKENAGNDAITNEVVAQAQLENYALKLFTYADQHDRAASYGKNVVKSFYTAGLIYDILLVFGELSDEAQKNGKYAKWKAAYIHNCLKNGETPVPGPLQQDDDENNEADADDNNEDRNPGVDQELPPSEVQPPAFGAGGSIPAQWDPSTLPSPPREPEAKNPGGFQPYVPPSPTGSGNSVPAVQAWSAPAPPAGSVQLSAEQLLKAQKYCKWAGSALTYEDTKSAVENLQKALHLVQFGQEL